MKFKRMISIILVLLMILSIINYSNKIAFAIPTDPTDINTKPDEAPFSIALDKENFSTLSGSLSVQATDLTLPGRNGLSFSLTRVYNSDSSQFYGMDIDAYGVNITVPAYDGKKYPIGKGWSWELPSVEIKNGKDYLHLPGRGTYEWDGTNLKGYPWLDIKLVVDSTVSVNNENSVYALKSFDGKTQYFNNEGRLIQISDAYNNKILFQYNQQGTYGKVLNQIQDAIGNTIVITYTSDTVTLTQGNKIVTYKKMNLNGQEVLFQVIDPLGAATAYEYTVMNASFNLLTYYSSAVNNPYMLLKSITYPTGAKTVYSYETTPVTRYVGKNSTNQSYKMNAREDNIFLPNGKVDVKNAKTILYSGDMGSSYDQNLVFSATVNDGLTQTIFNNKKVYYDAIIPPVYYNMNITSTAGTIQKITDYTYDEARRWYFPFTTSSKTLNTATTVSSPTLTYSQTYDDFLNVTAEVDANGIQTLYSYDPVTHFLSNKKQPISATLSNYTEYLRNTQGSTTQVAVKENNAAGRLMSQENYASFDSYGNVGQVTVKDDNNQDRITNIEYNNTFLNAFPTKISTSVTDINNITSVVSKQYEYNTVNGNLTKLIDGLNYSTTYEYDLKGRITKAIHPDLSKVQIRYDDFNNTMTRIDETGVTTYSKWNPLGWKSESGLISNGAYEPKNKNEYDAYGRLLWTEDALANRTNYQYDPWSRNTRETYPDSSFSQVQYDDFNWSTTTIDPEGNTFRSTTDNLGRVIKSEEIKPTKTIPLSRVSYNYVGNVLKSTDAKNFETNFSYDALGRLATVTNAKQETTGYNYSLAGNMTTITYPDTKTMLKKYDKLGRLIQTTVQNNKVEKMEYDANGNLNKLVDRNASTFNYQYTNSNLLWKKIAPDETITFGYDAAGRRISMADITGTTGYSYFPSTGQLKTLTYPDARTLNYNYDAQGNRSSMTDPFGAMVYYSYDSRNRLKSVGPSITDTDVSYTYYKNNLMKTAQLHNGNTSNYVYDGLELDTLIQKKSDSSTLNSFDYNYDDNKNITQKIENGVTSNYTYDALNRVATVDPTTPNYVYDSRGNRTRFKSKNATLLPDAKLDYDKRDRLSKVTTNGIATSYKYNGDGLLYERTENGTTTRYYNDNGNIISEANVNGASTALKARYIRGQNLIAKEDVNYDKSYYLENGHGDVIELRDGSGNTQLNKYTYDIWGNPIISNETVANPFRYSGEMWDKSTSLQYLRARWYDPSIGRFINEDTYEGDISNPLSLNLYTYVENNPLTNNDPSGHKVVKDTNQVAFLNGLVAKGGGTGTWAQSQLDQRIYYYDDTQGRSNQFAGVDNPTISQKMDAMADPNTSDDEKALLALGIAKDAVTLGISGAGKGIAVGAKAVASTAVKAGKAVGSFFSGLFSSNSVLAASELKTIGVAADNSGIRAVVGTADDAYKLFKNQIGSANITTYQNGAQVATDLNGITYTYRAVSTFGSQEPTINIEGISGLRKIKFIQK